MSAEKKLLIAPSAKSATTNGMGPGERVTQTALLCLTNMLIIVRDVVCTTLNCKPHYFFNSIDSRLYNRP